MGNNTSKTPVWEWIVAAIGLVLVAAAISTTVYRAFNGEPTPPILTFTVDSTELSGSGYLVGFSVVNSGSGTAAALSVEGILKSGEDPVETSTANFAYAPGNSVRKGGFFFTKNPNEFTIQIRALGFESP